MQTQFARWIAMSGTVEAKRSIAAQVGERVKSGKCLVCESDAKRRGLCNTHYQAFLRRQRDKDNKQEQVEFEESCIREGKILPVHEMARMKRVDPFDV